MTTWCARIALALLVPALGGPLALTVITTVELRDGSTDSLAALGYVVAVFLAVPALLGALITGLGWLLRGRTPRTALGLSIAGLVPLGVVALAVLQYVGQTLASVA